METNLFHGIELVFAAAVYSLYLFVKYKEKFLLFYAISLSLLICVSFTTGDFFAKYKITLIAVFGLAPMALGYKEGDKFMAKHKTIHQVLFRERSDYIFCIFVIIVSLAIRVILA